MLKTLFWLFFSAGCKDIYDKVYAREKAAGSSEIKALAYARVAAQNCESAGKGD